MPETPDNAVDLDALHTAICARIKAEIPDFVTVEAYREDRKNLPVPACLIDLIEMEPDPDADPGTSQLSVIGRFEALIIIGRRDPKKEMAVRRLAARVALLTRTERWGQRVGAGYPIACEPDAFSPELDQFAVWRVEWAQPFEIGASIWNNDGALPTDVLASWAPDIGLGHEDDYEDVG